MAAPDRTTQQYMNALLLATRSEFLLECWTEVESGGTAAARRPRVKNSRRTRGSEGADRNLVSSLVGEVRLQGLASCFSKFGEDLVGGGSCGASELVIDARVGVGT